MGLEFNGGSRVEQQWTTQDGRSTAYLNVLINVSASSVEDITMDIEDPLDYKTSEGKSG
jgi:hypothetical protein